jgi:serine phosphatase RsbU (regulator of sigma subunit)
MKLYRSITFFLLLLISGEMLGQDRPLVDSLKKQLETEISDSLRADFLAQIGWFVSYENLSEGLVYAQKSLELSKNIQNKNTESRALNVIGTIYLDLGDYSRATEAHLNAIRIREALADTISLATSYHNISLVYSSRNDFHKSLEYMRKAFFLNMALKNEQGLAASCSNLGNAYLRIDSVDQALAVFNNGLAYSSRSARPKWEAINLFGVAECLALKGNNEESEINLQQAFVLARKLNSEYEMIAFYVDGARIRLVQNKFDQALSYADSSLVLIRKIKTPDWEKEAWQLIAEIKEKKGDFIGSLEALTRFQQLKDSLLNENVQKHQRELETIYESEKKDHAINFLTQKKNIQNTYVLVLIVGFLLLLGLALLLFNRIKFRQRSNILLAKQNAEIDEKNKDITDSINYAKRIQEAMLPEAELLHKQFPESFILYHPKDIVSGDFYWTLEKDDLHFLAVADCTGYGVPGGFMSVMSVTLLAEIVSEQGITDPAEILERLRSRIISSLRQGSNEENNSDGLNIAIAVFDVANQQLNYAAANCNIWRLRYKTIERLSQDAICVGFEKEGMKPFSKFETPLVAGDYFLLHTNGFTRQLTASTKQRLDANVLEEIIEANHQFRSDVLKEKIIAGFEQAKGDIEQTDDMLMIGVATPVLSK